MIENNWDKRQYDYAVSTEIRQIKSLELAKKLK